MIDKPPSIYFWADCVVHNGGMIRSYLSIDALPAKARTDPTPLTRDGMVRLASLGGCCVLFFLTVAALACLPRRPPVLCGVWVCKGQVSQCDCDSDVIAER